MTFMTSRRYQRVESVYGDIKNGVAELAHEGFKGNLVIA